MVLHHADSRKEVSPFAYIIVSLTYIANLLIHLKEENLMKRKKFDDLPSMVLGIDSVVFIPGVSFEQRKQTLDKTCY